MDVLLRTGSKGRVLSCPSSGSHGMHLEDGVRTGSGAGWSGGVLVGELERKGRKKEKKRNGRCDDARHA